MKLKLIIFFSLLMLIPALTQAATPNEKTVKEQVQGYLQLMELRKAANPDIPAIKKLYRETLTSLVHLADQNIPGLKKQTEDYLEQAETSSIKSPPLQGVEKSLQLAFISMLNQSLSQLEKQYKNSKNAQTQLNLAKAYYGGVESTAKRRGEYIQSPNVFHDRMVLAFDFLQTAIKPKNLTQIKAGIGEIHQEIDKVYFLSVLYELEGIAANRGKNEVLVAEKQIEGKLFFQVIRNAAVDSSARDVIESQLRKPGAEMDLKLIKEQLKLAYPDLSQEFSGKF